MGSDAADTGRWKGGAGGDEPNGSHYTGAPNGISSMGGGGTSLCAMAPCAAMAWTDEERREKKGKRWTPGPIHRMDICADGKWGWMVMFAKGESTLSPLFWCNVPAERSNLPAWERGNDRLDAQTHKRQRKKEKKRQHTDVFAALWWFFLRVGK